jgi:hypothetical protein
MIVSALIGFGALILAVLMTDFRPGAGQGQNGRGTHER